MATKEERHFTTVRLALDKPCTTLLQEVLRQHVPEKNIYKLLNDPVKKRMIMPFLRKLKQESTLYPQTGVFNGSYADFDVSLLYVLIRNLTRIPDHNTGWGNAPDITDNSTAANVERIRLLRNKYAHGSTSQLTDKEFKKEWKIIISCIQGIEKTFPGNNTTFQDAAQKIFDEAKNQENIGETLTKCKEDIAHTSTRVESLQNELKNTQEDIAHTSTQVESLQDELKNTQDVIYERLDGHDRQFQKKKKKKKKKKKESQETEGEKLIFDEWLKEDDFFFSTQAAKEIENIVTINDDSVIVTGHSGSGKSAIIQHIALQYRERGKLVKSVKSSQELYDAFKSKGFNSKEYIFVFNDPIGKESYDELLYNEWSRYTETLNLVITKSKLLMTCRKSIFDDPRAAQFLQQEIKTGDINERKLKVFDINDNHCKLSTEEKRSIFKKHLPKALLSQEDFDKICRVDMYFPLLCSCCKSIKSGSREEIVKVFEEPVEFLKREIEGFKIREKEKYCALICLILCRNDLGLHDLQEKRELLSKSLELCELPPFTLPSTIIKQFEPLCGLFVKKHGGKYAFNHDFVMEVTTFVLGSENPKATIEYADLSFLRKRISVEKREPNDPFTILLDHRHINDLVNRLFEELFGERFIEVILNPCLRNEEVIEVFKQKFTHLANQGKLEGIIKPTSKEKEFHHLLKESDCKILQFLLSSTEGSPLFALIMFCHDGLAFHCLNLLEKRNYYLRKETLFFAVCCNGNKDFLRIFSEKEIDEYKKLTWIKMYPIHFVSAFHSCDILDKVIIKDINVAFPITNEILMTPLMMAVANNSKGNGENSLHPTESQIERRDRMVEALIQRGANVNLCCEGGYFPLLVACQNGYASTAQLLLNSGADVNMCMNKGVTSLLVACQHGHKKTARLLLNSGAYVNLCANNGVSPLFKSCQKGHEGTAQLLLNSGADVNLCQREGFSPLYVACQNGHESIAQLLLNRGADVNLCQWAGATPLHTACEKGQESIAFLLLNRGADVNKCQKEGASPLYIACQNGHTRTAQLLLNRGADVNLCSTDSISPLWVACVNGHKSTTHILLDSGADVNKCRNDGASPLHTACRYGHTSTAQLLLNSRADVNLSDKNRISPLWIACSNGHTSTAQLLLNSCADVNLCQREGISPLLVACQNGHESIAKLLLNSGAYVNLCQREGVSPLHVACQNGHESIAKLLLNSGAYVNLCQREGVNPLFIACQNGHESIAQLLLHSGADVKNEGASPLYVACENGHTGIAQLLLHSGAEVNLCKKEGVSPLFVACQDGHECIAQLLLNSGADVNSCRNNGVSPLMIACENGHTGIAQLLLDSGAEVNLCSNTGISPLYKASKNGYESIVQLLLRNGANVNYMYKRRIQRRFGACQNENINRQPNVDTRE